MNNNFEAIEAGFADSVSLSQGGTMTHDIDMNNYQLLNLRSPTLSHNAVTKEYVDSLAFDGEITFNAVGKVRYTATNATMASLTEDEDNLANGEIIITRGRASNGDGGQGIWRYDSSSSSTADTGLVVASTSGEPGRFHRLHSGVLDPLWFASELGAGLTAAANAMPTLGGEIKVYPINYTVTSQVVIPQTKNFYKIDFSGTRITWNYTGGSSIKIGDGTAYTQNVHLIGDAAYWTQSNSMTYPLFELRGVRGFHTTGFRGQNIYQLCKWGDPSDAQSCYQWWHNDCEWNTKSVANGGHDHIINANGSAGGYYEKNCFIEGDTAQSGKAVLYLDSNQGPLRFDHMTRQGGNWKWLAYGVHAVNARIVNVDWSPETRTDEPTSWAFYVVANSSGTKGGCEQISLRGTFGASGGLYLESSSPASGAGIQNVVVDNVMALQLSAEFVKCVTAGTGSMKQIHIRNNHMMDSSPSSNNVDCIVFDGDINESSITNNTMDRKATATYSNRYMIYNNTASTKSIWISATNTASDVNTGVVYDPNIGDLSIKRFCALNQDGTPRMAYPLTYSFSNFATSQTNAAMDTVPGMANFYKVPNRCRVVSVSTALNTSVAAGTLTIGAATGASIDTNLDIAHTSGDGSYLSYKAGSSALAAGDKVYCRYTSDGSLTANIDGTATLWVQEL